MVCYRNGRCVFLCLSREINLDILLVTFPALTLTLSCLGFIRLQFKLGENDFNWTVGHLGRVEKRGRSRNHNSIISTFENGRELYFMSGAERTIYPFSHLFNINNGYHGIYSSGQKITVQTIWESTYWNHLRLLIFGSVLSMDTHHRLATVCATHTAFFVLCHFQFIKLYQ